MTTRYTITRHHVRKGDGTRVECDDHGEMDRYGFFRGRERVSGKPVCYFFQQIEDAELVTVEVDRDGHKVDERPAA